MSNEKWISSTIIRPWQRYLNAWILWGFVYKIVQANEIKVLALVYPYWLARDNVKWIKSWDTMELDGALFDNLQRISRNEAKAYREYQ